MEHRIAVIGYSGSGKSTLGRRLADQYGCEVLHLDCVHWLPGWKERDNAEKEEIVSAFMDSHKSWVMDGNYVSTCYERRMETATQIIFLDFPVHICLYRARKRYFIYRGKSRKSITEGCEEKMDWEFLWWILREGRDKSHKDRYREICQKYSHKVVVLKSPREVKAFQGGQQGMSEMKDRL